MWAASVLTSDLCPAKVHLNLNMLVQHAGRGRQTIGLTDQFVVEISIVGWGNYG